MRFYLILLFSFILTSSCEKRILLDAEFPHTEDLVFCEIIGFVGFGFFGSVTQVQKVEVSGVHQTLAVIIREEGTIIYQENVEMPNLSFPYFVKNDVNYSIEIRYKGQTITSPQIKSESPPLAIENLNVDNQFIDSLQFDVATVSFDFMAPNNTHTNQNFFYAYVAELTSNAFQFIDLSTTSDTDSLSLTDTHYIEKRLPNKLDYHVAGIGLLSIDEPFYQYLKNIKQLEIIPNDDIEGHHGNLEGGIGYFGVVNYEVQLIEF